MEINLFTQVATISTMLPFIASLAMLHRRKAYLQFAIGLFTLGICTTYLIILAFHIRFLYLRYIGWLRLANIGCVASSIMLIVDLMGNKPSSDRFQMSAADTYLITSGLFITLLMLEKNVWNIENSHRPIMIYAALFIAKQVCIGRSNLN